MVLISSSHPKRKKKKTFKQFSDKISMRKEVNMDAKLDLNNQNVL